MKSLRMRLICGLLAGGVVLGSFSVPTLVRADDIDEYLDDLEDLSDEEVSTITKADDYDGDGDIDEKDIEFIETVATVAILDEYERQMEQAAQQAAQQAQLNAQQAQLKAQQEELERLKKLERDRNKYVSVTGVYVSSTDVTLTPGQTYQVIAGVKPDNANNRGVSFMTSDANVATVDGSGIIRGINPGSCIITARSNENGYTARTTVRVNPSAAVVAQTVAGDAAWMQAAATMIATAAPGATVNLVAAKPMSFDATVINALKARPDVGLLIAYPYNGHNYLMAIPAGYNLAGKMDKTGKVSFLKLATVNDGKVITAAAN